MNLLEALTRIGFTEYEAKVYLALLSENPATGYQISKKSGVPRSMVYETLSRLAARGAVLETVEERATLYRPLPPSVLLDRHEKELLRLVDGLREGLEERYQATTEEGIWSISGKPAALAYAAQLIETAQEELYLVLTDEAIQAFQQQLQAACKQGIVVRAVLTGEHKLQCGEVVRHPPLESELHGLTNTLVIVADGTEVLIASANHETKATITRSRHLVMLARQFVWMELFTQRVYAQLGTELLQHLTPEDRAIFESLALVQEE